MSVHSRVVSGNMPDLYCLELVDIGVWPNLARLARH